MTRFGKMGLVAGVAIALVVIVTLSAGWLRQPELPEGFASVNGRLEATEVNVAVKRAGRLSEVSAREGDLVQKGQVVARMDVRDLEAELNEARAKFQETVQAKSAAEAKVVQQRCAVDFAAAEFKRAKRLADQKLITEQEVDLARSRLDSERAGLKAAQASVRQAEAAIKAAEAAIESIQSDLDDTILKAPTGGRVLYRLAEPGEVLPVGGKVLTLIDISDLYMTVFLPTAHAGRVTIGSEARITFDARPEVVLPAQVSFISPEAQFTPKEVETLSEREKLMFRMKVRMDPQLLMAQFWHHQHRTAGNGLRAP
ncbi:MAG: HlyD family efflux transporter periplasmic adaptor subunit [Akkermansiaceae bacterium]|nr:HlyD family efflux transporter periplasmic adaptor subunit [Akkermansiaceae bacterium]